MDSSSLTVRGGIVFRKERHAQECVEDREDAAAEVKANMPEPPAPRGGRDLFDKSFHLVGKLRLRQRGNMVLFSGNRSV